MCEICQLLKNPLEDEKKGIVSTTVVALNFSQWKS